MNNDDSVVVQDNEGGQEFSREDMISEMSKIIVRAIPTVATYDMGLEYDYITSLGIGTGFGGMGQWPAYWFSKIDDDKWKEIREKLASCQLTIETLKDTELYPFAERLFEDYYGAQFRTIELNDMLSGLLDLPEALHGKLYALFDMGDSGYDGHKPVFFESEESLLEEFKDVYCNDIIPWEELEDKDVLIWYRRLETDFDSFPYYHYSKDNNDGEEEYD